MNGRKWLARMVMARLALCLVGLVLCELARGARAHSKSRAKSSRARVLSGRQGQAGAQTSRKSISASK